MLVWSKLSYHEKRPSCVCMAVPLKTVLRATKHHRSLVRMMKSWVLQEISACKIIFAGGGTLFKAKPFKTLYNPRALGAGSFEYLSSNCIRKQ